MRITPVYFRVPRNFEAGELFPDARRRSYANCLVDLVYRRWLRERGRGFVPLKTSYLLRLLPQTHYRPVREALEERGVIDCDHQYVADRKCFGYAVGAAFRTRCQAVACEDAGLRRRLKKRRPGAREGPGHRWLRENLRHLRFDTDRAREIAGRMQPDADSPLAAEEYRVVLHEIIDRYVAGDLAPLCDRFGRFHSPVTSLPSALRCCLNVDGAELVNLDLANSQPLIAGLLVALLQTGRTTVAELRRKRFDHNPAQAYRFFDGKLPKARRGGEAEEEGRHGPEAPPMPPIMITILPQVLIPPSDGVGAAGIGDAPADLRDYLACCQRGRLYESFLKDGLPREEIKRALFREVFYGPGREGPLSGRFARRFPTVFGALRQLKRGEYRRCAWLMQNAESTLFLGRIAERIRKECPEIPLVTIHDSALVPAHTAEFVETVMHQEFAAVGLRPTLHRESCGPEPFG